MKARGLFMLSIPLLVVMALVMACAPGPTAKPTSSPSPTQKRTATPTTSPTTSAPSTTTAKAPSTTAAAPFSFAGKTITVIVDVTAGGGSDMFARVVTRHMSRFLPGNPAILVRNMTGGGGTIGANYAYAAKPDGLTLLNASGTPVLSYLLGSSAVKYDVKKMIPVVSSGSGNTYFARPGIADTVQDIAKATNMVFGYAAGMGGQFFALSVEILNIPAQKVILAYGGSSDAARAFLAREINTCGATTMEYWRTFNPMVESKEIVPLFQVGTFDAKGDMVKDGGLPAFFPTVREVYQTLNGKEPSGMAWDAFRAYAGIGITNKFTWLLPPGVPDNIVQAYWGAAENLLKDPQFQKDTALLAGSGSPLSAGKSLADVYGKVLTLDPKVVDWLKQTFAKKYGIVLEGG